MSIKYSSIKDSDKNQTNCTNAPKENLDPNIGYAWYSEYQKTKTGVYLFRDDNDKIIKVTNYFSDKNSKPLNPDSKSVGPIKIKTLCGRML